MLEMSCRPLGLPGRLPPHLRVDAVAVQYRAFHDPIACCRAYPVYQRASPRSVVDAVESRIRELLQATPTMPGEGGVAERIGWEYSSRCCGTGSLSCGRCSAAGSRQRKDLHMQEISTRLLNWASIIAPNTQAQAELTSTMPFIYPHLALMPDCHL